MYQSKTKKLLEAKKKLEQSDLPPTSRLPKPSVQHCLLCFKPNPELTTFEGSEIFKMSLPPGNTKEITVNAVDLIITKAIWEEDVTLNRQEPSEIRFEDKGILKLIFEPPLLEQSGQLRLNFKGNISDKKLVGFYAYNSAPQVATTEEIGPDGVPFIPQSPKQMNLMTGFSPAEARRCFPCWDDPASKLTYDIIMVVPKNSVVVGPTPVKATFRHKRDPTLEVAEFKRTPKLAPCSLGLGFGTYESLERKTADDEILVRIYAPPGRVKDGEFALHLACKAIPFFAEYFGMPLDLQKIDLVAVPNAIGEPADSWGLIFFRSTDLLVEPVTAIIDLMWISLVLCHEITQQWFGGLVTCEWWSHEWLKEGIAAFVKYVFVNIMFPEMEVWTHFVTHTLHKALAYDGMKASHSVEIQVLTVSDIEDAVDDICLNKTPSLLRMVHRFVGDGAFRRGLEIYLTRFKHGNATSSDFWRCLQEASSKPIVTLMNTWMSVRGYPLLTVTAKQEGKNRFLKMTQERFSYEPGVKEPKAHPIHWMIPLTFSTRNHPNQSVLDVMMDQRTLTVTITDVQKTDWVKINPGSIGFFRVKYPHDMYTHLVFAIREKSLPPLDRLNILDDYFAFLLAGYSTTVEVLSLLEAFIEDDDYSVWVTVSNVFEKCMSVFDHVGKADSFQAFGKYIFSTIYAKLGWLSVPEESIQKKLLRTLVLEMMSRFNHADVNEQCRLLFEQSNASEDATPIPVDLRNVVYRSTVLYGDDGVAKRFIRLYRECESAEEKDKLAYAIGSTKSPTQIPHVLDFSMSDEVRRGHTILILSTLAKTKIGKEMTWTFIKENFTAIKNRYGPLQASRLFTAVLEDFTSDDRVNEIQEFFKSTPFPGTERAVQHIVESIKINEMWLKREKNLTALQDYLESMY